MRSTLSMLSFLCFAFGVKNFVPCPRSQRLFFSPKIFYCTFPKFSSFMLKLMIHFEFCVNCETLVFPSLLPPSPTLPLPYPCMSNCCCSHSFVTPWIIALQAPLSMGFFLQEYGSGLPCPPPGDLPDPGTEPTSCSSCIARRILYHFATWEAQACLIAPAQLVEKAVCLSFIKTLLHICQKSLGHICVGLFPVFLFCSVDLGICSLHQHRSLDYHSFPGSSAGKESACN
ncbi:unnamed protein product [Rangifer tarandus platyrhynchus]|uniref:Secreted protein n=2 Tax=Rangifer tarandus platyrhynchus TaxID=3082113 RepID=A0ABN8YVX2_RANTA|nr:unnamed protein product [Rangifer tarandus platyrhynchus]